MALQGIAGTAVVPEEVIPQYGMWQMSLVGME